MIIGIQKQADWWEKFMKYPAEMGSGVMTNIPNWLRHSVGGGESS
jgi:hypothetical protein